MRLAFVQPLYRARSRSEFAQISVYRPIRHYITRASLRVHPGRWAFSTNSRFTFLGFLPHSFLLICTLRWCNHFIVVEVGPNLLTFFHSRPIRHCSTRGSLRARNGRCAFCTNSWFTFLGSPSPWIPFYMHLALVQPLDRARSSSEFAQTSIHGFIQHCSTRGTLWTRSGQWAFSTNSRFIFLVSPFP